MTPFVSGRELSQAFYREVVAPIIEDVPHAACLLGPGSDVLGYDTAMSMDHDWGPRLQILVLENPTSLNGRISQNLPREFKGYPVFFKPHSDGTVHMDDDGDEHNVKVAERDAFLASILGAPTIGNWTTNQWLSIPQQRLLEATADNVFHDEIGLRERQAELTFFPRDILLYLLASLWRRIGQEEHLMGRAGTLGDELGARIIAGRVVRDLMRICFLLEGQYIPYPKWFGTAFTHLKSGPELATLCRKVLEAVDWQNRDSAFVGLVEAVARLQNESGLCPPLLGKAGPFYGRPYSVVQQHMPFDMALMAAISDASLRMRPMTGSIDFVSDNTDVLCGSGLKLG